MTVDMRLKMYHICEMKKIVGHGQYISYLLCTAVEKQNVKQRLLRTVKKKKIRRSKGYTYEHKMRHNIFTEYILTNLVSSRYVKY